MSSEKTKSFLFSSPDDYEFDSDAVEISDLTLALKMQEATNFYSQDYSDPDNFDFEADKVEFSEGKVLQKDQRPPGATMGAKFSDSINANWGGGSLTATPFNGAGISGGKLDCTAGKYITLSAVSNADFAKIGCLRFKMTPNYTGAPASSTILFALTDAPGSVKNLIQIIHNAGNGTIILTVYDNASQLIFNSYLGAWLPTSGVGYELELNLDLEAGATRLFINGAQLGATETGTGNRAGANVLFLGANYGGSNNANAYFQDFLAFPAVQHAANYTPGYEVSETIYLTSNVTLPEMEHIGAGTLLLAASFETDDFGGPRYTLQIDRSGDFLYWDGSEWSVSDGSFEQATDEATFNEHVELLPVDGAMFGQFKIHFSAGAVAQWVDLTRVELLETTGFLTSFQKIKPKARFEAGRLISFLEDAEKPENTSVRYTIEVDGREKYWDGEKIAESNGTIWEANTIVELNAGAPEFISSRAFVRPVFYLRTTDNAETPELTSFDAVFVEDPQEMRGFLDSILGFIESESLTDVEYASEAVAALVSPPDYTREMYLALRGVLEARDNISDAVSRLTKFFEAKGVDVSEAPATPTALSNIFIGGSL